jgi:hypothetical protein
MVSVNFIVDLVGSEVVVFGDEDVFGGGDEDV